MKAKVDVPSLEYHKMYLHFCSEQCRETFIAHPSLYSVLPQKQRKEILKCRTMSLAKALTKKNAQFLINSLTDMMGVKDVIVDGDKLQINYDLLQTTRKQVENRLLEVGVTLGNNWVEHFRSAWVHNSEENELANLAAPFHYYNRPSPK